MRKKGSARHLSSLTYAEEEKFHHRDTENTKVEVIQIKPLIDSELRDLCVFVVK